MSDTAGFFVISSNDLESLAAICAKITKQRPLSCPLGKEQILVMSLGMRNYLSQTLALANGIFACADFKQEWQLIFDVYKTVFPRIPHRTSFSRQTVAWSILGLGDEVWQDKAFTRLREYVADDPDGSRRFELAQKLADAFDQYQIYRPDWILAWDELTDEDFRAFYANEHAPGKVRDFLMRACRGQKTSALSAVSEKAGDGAGGSLGSYELLKSNLWQAHLWVKLRGNLKARDEHDAYVEDPALLKDYFLDRAQLMSRLIEAIVSGKTDLSRLPERVFVFGVSALPPIVIDFLSALGTQRTVYLMLLNPCQEYWGDITDNYKKDFEEFRKRVLTLNHPLPADTAPEDKKLLKGQSDPENYQAEFYGAEDEEGLKPRLDGNQLLLSLGRQGRDNLSLLFSLNPEPSFIDCFIDEQGENLLSYLKQDLLSLKEGGSKRVVRTADRSLEIHSCHTKRREVEVLRDLILNCFKEAQERGEKLEPRDIVVMVPTINEYAPYITAVFGSFEEGIKIPFAISDRTTLEASPVANAVLRLMDLHSSPITSADILDLLSVESIGRRFNIKSDDVEVIGSWLKESCVFWGLDEEDVHTQSEIDLPGTLRAGLDRMILGTMLGDNDEAVSYNEIEGQDAKLLGSFNDFIEALIELKKIFTPSLKAEPNEWRSLLTQKLQQRFFDDDEDTLVQFKTIDAAVADLVEVNKNLIHHPEVKLPVFRAVLAAALESARDFTPYLRDKINFCSLIPMRAVPFKHIFVLGLNDLSFPRRERMPGFNLMGIKGLGRRGDRSRGVEDRFLFLETILSAQQSLCFSYIGESPNSKQELMPSSVISELLDYITDNFVLEGFEEDSKQARAALRAHIVKKEHLSAYHPDNYTQAAGRVPSFDKDNFISEVNPILREAQPIGLLENWGLTLPAGPIGINLDDLCSFLRKPMDRFLKKVMGINLDSGLDDEAAESEAFKWENYDKGGKLSELLALDAKDVEPSLRSDEAFGRLPYSVFGEKLIDDLMADYQSLCGRFHTISGLDSPSQVVRGEFQDVSLEVPVEINGQKLQVPVILRGQVRNYPFVFEFFSGGLDGAQKLDPEDKDSPAKQRASFVFYLLTEALARFLAGKEEKPVTLIAKNAGSFELSALSHDELQGFLNEAVGFYLLGLTHPYPASSSLLEKYAPDVSLDESVFQYDAAARYLFKSPDTILKNKRLCKEFLSMHDFYVRLCARVEQVKE